jgi:putative flippase GtrA
VEALNANVVISTSLGAVAGGMFNYWFNYRYTFGSSASHTKASIKYAIVISASFFINGAIMALGVRYIDLNYLLIQVIATVIVFMWNFIGSKKWVF